MTAFERRDKNIVDLQPNRLKRYVAYMIYGLWVHFRVFPILLLPMLIMYEFHSVKKNRWRHLFKYLLEFGLISGGVFIALSIYYYSLYGYDFLHETYFYHLTRRDNRHSRSIFFYELYLNFESDKNGISLWRVLCRNLSSWCFFGFFWVYLIRKRSYFFCQCFLIVYFVFFNRVITDQYYTWVFTFLNLLGP
jgi:phosphatidylinositol glycan class M